MKIKDVPINFDERPCECGCGSMAGFYATTNYEDGAIAGRPRRFAHGHNAAKPWSDEEAIKIFFKSVRREFRDECWEWTGYCRPNDTGTHAYGCFSAFGYQVRAHQFSYAIHFGPIPDGLHVCHHCDNPKCVNPKHLYAGTHQDNMRDMRVRGRNVNARKTHCVNGHAFTTHNTHFTKEGYRQCKACIRARDRKRA